MKDFVTKWAPLHLHVPGAPQLCAPCAPSVCPKIKNGQILKKSFQTKDFVTEWAPVRPVRKCAPCAPQMYPLKMKINKFKENYFNWKILLPNWTPVCPCTPLAPWVCAPKYELTNFKKNQNEMKNFVLHTYTHRPLCALCTPCFPCTCAPQVCALSVCPKM